MLLDVTRDLSTLIFSFCVIEIGARLIDVPVSQMTSACIGFGTLFFFVGLLGETRSEKNGIFLWEDSRAAPAEYSITLE